MSHAPIHVKMTRAQIMKLMKGGNVRLAHHQLKGHHVLHVNLKTHRRHAKAHRMGCGIVIPSHAVNKASLAQMLGTGRAHSVGRARRRHVHTSLSKSMPRALRNPFSRPSLESFNNGRPALVQGLGRRRHRMMHGGAWYDDLWSGVKTAASYIPQIAKVAKPLLGLIPHPAAQGAASVLGALGGRVRHRRHMTPANRAIALRNLAKARAARGMGLYASRGAGVHHRRHGAGIYA